VDLATRLFRAAGTTLAPFGDEQVAQGLYFLCGEGMPDAHASLSPEVTEASAVAYVDAMPELFRQVFAERCRNGLGHLSEPPATSLCAATCGGTSIPGTRVPSSPSAGRSTRG
jgi:hypothetical protein